MLESLTTSYLESVASKFPVQRTALFAIGFIVSLVLPEALSDGVVGTLVRLKLTSLAAPKEWPLTSASLGSVLLGLAYVFVGIAASRSMAAVVFLLADRATNLRSKVSNIYRESAGLRTLPRSDRETEIAIIDGALAPVASAIRSVSSLAEFAGSLGLSLLILSVKSGLHDCLVGVLLLLVMVLSVIRSVQIFISDYFALAAHRNQLQGRGDLLFEEVR